MPVKQSEKTKTKKKAAPKDDRVLVRLRRDGANGEFGLRSYFVVGRLFKREGIYPLDAALARRLVNTGKFEYVEDLEQAKAERNAPRGMTLDKRLRAKRRAAMHRRRSYAPNYIEEGEDDGEVVGLEDVEASDSLSV